MRFAKYHALGNDYLVMPPTDWPQALTVADVRQICHRHFGVGSDGILYGPLPSETCDFGLKIFNPDGSEAEKSGNGLRIFARYLCDEGLVGDERFTVETLGGEVQCQVDNLREIVTVEMGSVSFNSEAIPVTGQAREVLEEEIQVNDQTFTFCAATVGNPHCVIFVDELSEAETRRFGPLLESDSRFPNRTNVQFAKVIDRTTLQIEIWERGAGYTLASGSSSTAVAAVAYRLGLCEADVAVKMPGGALHIHLNEQFHATLAGPATKICDGVLTGEMIATNWVQSAAGNNDPLILVPADVPGSWRAMLAIYDRLDRNDRLFQWESESDYHRNKARKSRPMLDLIRNLAQTDLRQRFRIGGGLFGVGLRMPTESDSEKRMVAISVTVDRQIEVRLLDITDFGPLPPVIDQVVCDQEKAVQHIRSYAQRL